MSVSEQERAIDERRADQRKTRLCDHNVPGKARRYRIILCGRADGVRCHLRPAGKLEIRARRLHALSSYQSHALRRDRLVLYLDLDPTSGCAVQAYEMFAAVIRLFRVQSQEKLKHCRKVETFERRHHYTLIRMNK